MRQPLVPLLVLASLATGCTARQRMVAGGIAVVSGVMMAGQPVETTYTHCAPGQCETLSDAFWNQKQEDSSLRDGGVALAVVGLVLAIHGLTTMGAEDRADAIDAEIARQEAERAAREAARRAALPPAPPKPPPPPPPSVESRLAMQASMIAKTGNCAGARATARRLAEIDADAYARLLRTDDAVARCSSL